MQFHNGFTKKQGALPFAWLRIAASLLSAWIALPSFAQSRIGVSLSPAGNVQLRWNDSSFGMQLEGSSELGPGAVWQAETRMPVTEGDVRTVELPPSLQARFFRLRQAGELPQLTITDMSPARGETGVAVSRETIIRLTSPLSADTVLGLDRLSISAAGRPLLIRIELSTDRRTVTLFPLEFLPGDTRVTVAFDGTGLFDTMNRPVDLDGDGVMGGVAKLEFDTLSTVALQTTGIQGRVLASERNLDGSDRPLRNVTITVDGMEETLRAKTDANGFFRLVPCPAGRFFVSVDGRTADGSEWPGGAYYPFVGKAWDATPGRTNNPAGGSGVIYLPLIQAEALRPVSAVEETKIRFAPSVLATNPALSGVEISVPPNSLFANNGTRGGRVGIAPVPRDRLPEPLPPGLNLPMVITIQTDGPSNFDTPVPVKFPNLPDPVTGVKLLPGAKSAIWSFNHDTGRWEMQGPATVTADGNFVMSDPGVGVRQPGWHGNSPGGGGGGPGGPPPTPGPCPGSPGCNPPKPDRCEEPDSCGGLHYEYRELLAEWLRDAALRESYTEAGVVNKGRRVDAAYAAYVACRDANGWPCDGGPASINNPASENKPRKTSHPPEVYARMDVAIQNTVVEESHYFANTPLPKAGAWYALESLETSFVQRGRLNNQASVENIVLAPNERYRITYFDVANRRAGTSFFVSRGSGVNTFIPTARLYGAEFSSPDADGDGISDTAEFVLGTKPNSADSDGDGVSDAAEIQNGTNPSDGQPLGLGLLATRNIPGPAFPAGLAVDVDTVNDLAVIANSSRGLAVFNIENPLAPVLVNQFTPGNVPTLKSVSVAGNFVAAMPGATGNPSSRLYLFRLLSDGTLSENGSVALTNSSDAVVAAGLFAYVSHRSGNAPTLAVIRLSDGVLMRHVPIKGTLDVTALAIDGDVLWALTDSQLFSFRIAGDNLLPLGELGVSGLTKAPLESGLELTAGIGRVYVGGFQGFHVIDGSNPSSPALIFKPSQTQAAIHDMVLNGSGLLLPVTSFAGESTLAQSVYDIRNDRSTNFLTSFNTPGTTRAVTLHRGYAMVADGREGIAVVNFLAPDIGTNPPTVALRPNVSHPPSEQEADQPFYVSTVTSDDVQVRDVEFLIDGVVVARAGKFPFAATLNAPPRLGGKTNFILRAKATDTGGNSSWSDPLTLTLLPDRTPVRYLGSIPSHGSVPPNGSVSTISAIFDSTVDLQSLRQGWTLFSPGADGAFGTVDDIPVTGAEFAYDVEPRISLLQLTAPLKPGKYRSRLASSVSDLAGNALGTHIIWEFTLPYPRLLKVQPTNNFTMPRGSVTQLSAEFDAVMDVASVRNGWTLHSAGADGRIGTPDDVPVPLGETSFSRRTAIAKFVAPLPSGIYRAQISSNVLSLSGDVLATNHAWSFTIPTPKAISSEPPDKSVFLPGTFQRIDITFDERLGAATVTPANIQFQTTNQANPFVPPLKSFSLAPDARTVSMEFTAPVPNGVYRFRLSPDLRDVYGSPVSTNFPTQVVVKGPALWTNHVSGIWSGATNWDGRSLPLLNDHVIIDLPNADPTISLRSSVGVTTLRSDEAFGIDNFNGNLTVLDRAVFNAPLTMSAGGGGSIEGRLLEVNGPANLVGRIQLGEEAVFTGPVSVTNAADFSLAGGRSRFFDRFDTRRTVQIGGHILTLEPGAVGTMGDNQFGFGGANSRLVIAPGARLELTPTNTAFGANSFAGNQGETGALVENSGEFVKRGAASSFFLRMELLNKGLLSIDEGMLSAGNDFTNHGTIRIAAGARLEVGGGFKQTANGRIEGGGTLRIPGSATVDGPYELIGKTEIAGQNPTVFRGPIRSTGEWLITGTASFDGPTTELLGPVILEAGRLVLNSPGETIVRDLRLETSRFGGGNLLGGTGRLVFREATTFFTPVAIVDSLTLRFEAPLTVVTNFNVTAPARVELAANSRWTGGSFSGNVFLLPDVELELAAPAPNVRFNAAIQFPTKGIIRKTTSAGVGLRPISGGILTNISLIDVGPGFLGLGQFVQTDGKLRLSGAGSTVASESHRFQGGMLTGEGTVVTTSGSLNRGCLISTNVTVEPGNPIGTIQFNGEGAPVWQPGSRTIFEIAGTNAGVTHDQIKIERALTIQGGTLEIRVVDGFSPALGQEFIIMTGTTRTGQFTEVVGGDYDIGRRLQAIYGTKDVRLRVVAR